MIRFGYRVQITSLGGDFTKGTIEPGGYTFEALILDKPSSEGIDSGRISKLEIRDRQGQLVVEYDRGFGLDDQGRPARHSAAQRRLIKAMAQTFPGKLERQADRPASPPDKPKAPLPRQIEAHPAGRLRLDQYKLADRNYEVPPQKLFVPPQRVRFEGFSCLVPPGCPEPETFRAITTQLATEHFGSERQAATALRAFEACMDTKGQFCGYPEAVQRYQEARVLSSPEAQAWEEFERAHDNAFRDYDEDGRDIEPVIPGWQPGRMAFESDENERGAKIAAEKARGEASRGDAGREPD